MAASKAIDDSKETIVDGFEPSLWGDFFVTYTPLLQQRSEEWMRERRDQLKGEVRRMFEDGKAMSMADTVKLVDTLERLGIDDHFVKEIDTALNRVYNEELDFGNSNDLHVVALRFRLLRQHGFWVPTDVFDKFRDNETGSFNINIRNDPRGLLSLYNAAHMVVPGEMVLDDAISFARRHLEAAKGKLESPMEEQVSRALHIPLPRFMWQMETVHYITEYEKEDPHDSMILELARLNFILLRSVHLKELKSLSLWWRDLYDSVKLTYSRDRIVECYFYSITLFHGEENSIARIILTKMYAILVLLDDTFDVRATFEEAQMLDEAVQRWDESAVSLLPDYLRMFYIKTLSNFNDIEDMLEPSQKYRMAYVKEQFKLQSNYCLQQAKWLNENCLPSFKEQIHMAVRTTGLQYFLLVTLMGAGQVVNNEAFEWGLTMPDMSYATAEIGRFINDIAAYKLGKCKNDFPSVVECYMKEYDMTGEEATAAVADMMEQAWRRMNKDYIGMKPTIAPVAQCLLNIARCFETFYVQGTKDGLTYGRDVKELIATYFLKQVHV
ncbi:hypothetical protein HU200_063411 [Digitaria exilis]|uniref:Uncharacterized protein n=1 Tax=Digitaria exilis TaxID=1010633 RepID=A0A835A3P9_9POAL|nr:hypothetical protein HU200_063411 [Digitaria exilis]